MNGLAQLVVPRLVRERVSILRRDRVRAATHALHVHAVHRVAHPFRIVIAAIRRAHCLAIGHHLVVVDWRRAVRPGFVVALIVGYNVVLIVPYAQFAQQRLQVMVVVVVVVMTRRVVCRR